MESTGIDRILSVSGSDVTLQGLVFSGGKRDALSESGGNVLIEAPGHHRIENCKFLSGISGQLGGNIHVDTPDSVTITNSYFQQGKVRYGGGGISIINAEKILIQDCIISHNEAGGDGGGLIVYGTNNDVDQEIFIKNTTFSSNEAEFGGGFLATSFGSMPRLDIQLSTFEDNIAGEEGAAAAVFHYVMDSAGLLDLTLNGIKGSSNVAPNNCQGLYIIPHCLNVADTYP